VDGLSPVFTALFCASLFSLGTSAVARALIQQNKNQEAISQLKLLAAGRPDMKGIERELGIAYYHEADYLKAGRHLEQAWRENPEDRDVAQLLGPSYYFSDKPAEAIPALEKVRLWHPNTNIDAVYTLGLCYVMTTNYPQALETFARLYVHEVVNTVLTVVALRLVPNNPTRLAPGQASERTQTTYPG
jgi:tetratricopeptide (TPR) repeat protein